MSSVLMQVDPMDYHTDPRLKCDRSNILSPTSWMSKSALWEFADVSLFKWRYYPKEYKPTKEMQWGSLIDCLTTTPELEGSTLAFSPYKSFRTNEAKAWRDEQLEAQKIIIDQETLDEARIAADMLLHKHPLSSEIFRKSKTQAIIGAKINGVQFKGLVDLVPEGEDYLVDLKTTNDFSHEGFSKTIAKFGYHVQAALYLTMWNATFPDDQRKKFRFIWQDSSAPYEVCVKELALIDIESGRSYARFLLKQLIDATKAGKWPMLGGNKVEVVTRPAWAAISEDQKMQEGVEA